MNDDTSMHPTVHRLTAKHQPDFPCWARNRKKRWVHLLVEVPNLHELGFTHWCKQRPHEADFQDLHVSHRLILRGLALVKWVDRNWKYVVEIGIALSLLACLLFVTHCAANRAHGAETTARKVYISTMSCPRCHSLRHRPANVGGYRCVRCKSCGYFHHFKI